LKNGEIIRMAQEVGIFTPDLMCVTVTLDMVERFAALVAAAEREACARVCESLEIPDTIEGSHPDYVDGKRMAVMQSAAAIRARGNE